MSRSSAPLMAITVITLCAISLAQTDAVHVDQVAEKITRLDLSSPRVVRFSGAIPTHSAAPIGVATLTFALYSESQGGTPLWLETHNVQIDEQGRYTVLLGAGSRHGLALDLFTGGEARWLGVRVATEGADEQPRMMLVSVPYALTAADAQALGGRPVTDFQLTPAAMAAGGSSPGAPEGAGAVSSTGNTTGRLAKFTGTDAVGDSILTENAGMIGLGANPAFPLHIEASSSSAAVAVVQNHPSGFGLLVKSGNDATPAFLMNNAANTANKHIFYGSGDAAFAVGGGRIGIGISSPIYPLQIEANNDSAAMSLVQNNPNGFALLVRPGNDNTPAFLMNNTANSANRHVFYGSGEALFALGGGNVGIGTNAPTQKLQVAGQVYSSLGGFRFPDGTVQTTASTGGGDITAVNAGTGLSGGGTSGDVTVSVNPALVQSRVTGSCAVGNYMRVINQDGSVTCGADQAGGGSGTVTSISAGSGLTGSPNPITTTGTISANFAGAGGDNGSATTVARGDHLHDGRYVQIVPTSFTYSNASVQGRYAFTEFGAFSDNGVYVFSGHGHVVTNGNGQITSGSLTESSSYGYTCTFSLTGTYSVGGSGQGSVSLTATAVSGGCGTGTNNYTIQVTQQGAAILLSEAAAGGWTSVVALKQ